jgi:hypothetical protein
MRRLKLNKLRPDRKKAPFFTRFLLPVLLLPALPVSLPADWGVLISEQFESDLEDPAGLASKTVLAPWLSLPLGDRGDFYLSAGAAAYYHDEGPEFFPELFRLELTLRPLPSLTFRAGRIDYRDPGLFTAKGRFDGADLTWDAGPLRLAAGGYYTGLLYRNTAHINAAPGDPAGYAAALDYGAFADTYFAPRRALASLGLEYPGFIHPRGALRAGFLSQYDCSGAEEKLHIQYLLFRYVLSLPGGFGLEAAGARSFRAPGSGKAASAVSLDGSWMPAGGLRDRLSLGFRRASGEGDFTAAYIPVVREAQGTALQAGFSGLMVLSAGYEARFLTGLSAELGGRYFFRTDTVTFSGPYLQGDSPLLGLEVSGALLWAPLSDFSLSLRGGVFLPRTGEALKDAPVYRQLTLGLICSL